LRFPIPQEIDVKKSLLAVAMVTVIGLSAGAYAENAAAAPIAHKGKMLYSANGGRLASVYRVDDDGAVALILDGKMRTVPADTLSVVDGKLTTRLSKADVLSLR
jgi:hypothetical protein